MTKRTGKGKVNATARAKAERKAIEERQAKEFLVSREIEAVLTKHKMALQPFLQFSEYGLIPRVRLADNKEFEMPEQLQSGEQVTSEPTETNDQGTNTEEAGGDSEESQPTDAE